MTPKEVVDFYGTQQKAADAIGCSQQSVQQWVASGCVPKLRQYQIEKISKGKLKIGNVGAGNGN